MHSPGWPLCKSVGFSEVFLTGLIWTSLIPQSEGSDSASFEDDCGRCVSVVPSALEALVIVRCLEKGPATLASMFSSLHPNSHSCTLGRVEAFGPSCSATCGHTSCTSESPNNFYFLPSISPPQSISRSNYLRHTA